MDTIIAEIIKLLGNKEKPFASAGLARFFSVFPFEEFKYISPFPLFRTLDWGAHCGVWWASFRPTKTPHWSIRGEERGFNFSFVFLFCNWVFEEKLGIEGEEKKRGSPF